MIPLRIVLASLACLYPFSLAQEPKSDPDKTLIIILPAISTAIWTISQDWPHW